MGKFTGRYTLDPIIPKPNAYYYIPGDEPLTYWANNGKKYVLTEMFETDMASVPRLFWPIKGFAPADYPQASIFHDWLFELHHLKRPDAEDFYTTNKLLQEALITAGCSWFRAYLYRKACDLVGKPVWDGKDSIFSPHHGYR